MPTALTPELKKQIWTNRTGVKDAFKKYKISHWNQAGSFKQELDLGKGICRGMCLDWVRRVLHGQAKTMHSSFWAAEAEKKALLMQRDTHRLFTAATRGVSSGVNGRIAANLGDSEQLGARMTTLSNKNAATLQDMLKVDQKAPDSLAQLKTMVAKIDSRAAKIKAIEARVAELSQEIVELRAESNLLVRQAYGAFRIAWNRQFDGVDKAGNFDDIVLKTKGERAGEAGDGQEVWANYLLGNLQNLKVDECGLLFFDFEVVDGDEGGHVMAFWNNHGTDAIFDPNIGWYAFTNRDGLRAFFEALWNGLYGLRGISRLEWQKFKRA